MTLSFILDVEGENVLRQIFPLRRTWKKRVLVLKDMGKTVVEVVNWRWVLVEERYVILRSRPYCTIQSWKLVL